MLDSYEFLINNKLYRNSPLTFEVWKFQWLLAKPFLGNADDSWFQPVSKAFFLLYSIWEKEGPTEDVLVVLWMKNHYILPK